jgi:glycosyltransferase involved in cell wall biosynthesis
MKVSLICTVRNERQTIQSFLTSVANQTKRPDEMVIVDGNSNDGTPDIIRSFKGLNIKLIIEPCNIAQGRNIAISNSSNELIAVTDGGCVLERNWLERISNFDSETDVIVGNYRPILRSLFDACQYSLHSLFKSDKDLDKFVISSRSLAFKKKVWEEQNGYPEWMKSSEDALFHDQIKKANYRIRFERDAVVRWELRKGLRSLFNIFFIMMEGNGLAGMNGARHLIRFSTYGVAFILLLLGFSNPLYLCPLIVCFLFYVSVPIGNFLKLKKYSLASGALIMIPLLLIYVDIAKMSGYLSGLVRRLMGLGGIRMSHRSTGPSGKAITKP